MSKNKKLLIFPCLIIIVCGYIIGFNMVRRADGVGEIVKAPAVAAANIENSGNNDSSGNDKSAGLLDTTGLCLTDVEILPHYHRFLPRFEHFEEAHTGL